MVVILEESFIKEVLQYIHLKRDLITFQFVNKKIMRLYKTILSNPVIDMSTVPSPIDYYSLARSLFPKIIHFKCPFDFSLLNDNEITKFNKCSITHGYFDAEIISSPKMVGRGVLLQNFKRPMPLLEIIKQPFNSKSLIEFIQNVSNFPSLQYIQLIIGHDLMTDEKTLISSIITLLNTIQNVKICICYEIKNNSDFTKIELIRKSLPVCINHMYNHVITLPDKFTEGKESEEEILQYKFIIPIIPKLQANHFINFLENDKVAKEYIKYFYPLEIKGHLYDLNLEHLTTITKVITDNPGFKLKLPISCTCFEDLSDSLTPGNERIIENISNLNIKKMTTSDIQLIPLNVEDLEIPFSTILHCPSSLTKLVLYQVDKKDDIVFNTQLKALSIGEYPKTFSIPTTLTSLTISSIKNQLAEGIQNLEIGKLKKSECNFIPQSVTALTVLCGTTFDLTNHPNIKSMNVRITIANSIFKASNFLVNENLEFLSLYIAGKITKKKRPTFIGDVKKFYSHVKNVVIDTDFNQIMVN
ncbi:hypothetical protein KM1_197620 [Entamoeba histolytica HM-3:IMSS]|nr:hypothetical protein KM1_197620 [Entamoeba histolytica HM-3:IMSS]GAT95110.1 hypothetical protein CL6EHI_085020 [Entamoeba histolytica]